MERMSGASKRERNTRTARGRAFGLAAITLLLVARPVPAVDVVKTTLQNGLRVAIVHNTLAPLATTEVTYLVGSDDDPDGSPGMAHAQEHMMFRGSPGLSADQLASLMALMGGEFHAYTRQTVTQYTFTVPVDDLDTALRVEATRMSSVLDSPKLWRQERCAIEQEAAEDESSPDYVKAAWITEQLYAGTPYAQSSLGAESSFERMTAPSIAEFHHAWYTPANAVLVIVGNVDPEKTLGTVKRLFEPLRSRPVPARRPIRLPPLHNAAASWEADLAYGEATVAYRLPGYESADYAVGLILADVLDSPRSRLHALVAEGKALSASFSSDALPMAASGCATVTFAAGDDGDALTDAIKASVAEYLRNGFPTDLVEAAKRSEVADAEFAKNSLEDLADVWSEALAVEGRTGPDDDVEAMKKVTVADVNRVAREWLVNGTAVAAVLTPRPSGRSVAATQHEGKESFAPKRVKGVRLPRWARSAASPAPVPSPGSAVYSAVLTNGLRLIVQPMAVSRTVGVYGRVRSNSQMETPAGLEGVDQVLGDLFAYGSGTLDALAFQKALDDIAATEAAGTDFSIEVPVWGFDRAMALLADNMLRPALAEDAFRVVQRNIIAALAGERQSASYLSNRALMEGLYPPGDPRLREATPDTVASLTLAAVKSYYRQTFRPDLTTLVVIGDVTPERARAVVERCFGPWHAEGPRPVTAFPPAPLNKPAATRIVSEDPGQCDITLAETLGITRTHPDYATLQLGCHVLSGGFYATRLYHDLR